MRLRGALLVPRRYSLVTEAGYVPAHDDRPDAARGGPRAPLARAPGHERGGPVVPHPAHRAGRNAASPPARARGRAGGERLAGDPALRPPLTVDLRVGPGGGHLRRGTHDFRHARLVVPGPAHRGPALPRRGDLPHRVRPEVATAAGRVPGRAPGRYPQRGVWP